MSNPQLIGMKIHLTEEQRIKLRNLHSASRDRLVCDRIRCVLLYADSWTTEMIAHSQLIHETTVRRHLNDWLNDEKLAPENGGSDSYLNEEQTAERSTLRVSGAAVLLLGMLMS